jgi:hypothetical protein
MNNCAGGKALAPGVIRDVDFHDAHSDLPSGWFGSQAASQQFSS